MSRTSADLRKRNHVVDYLLVILKSKWFSSPASTSAVSSPCFEYFAGTGTKTSEPIAFNPKRFSRVWRVASRIVETQGAVRFVHPQPKSVVEGSTESNGAIVMFVEREGVTLRSATAVTVSHPGLYTTFHNRASWLPTGVKLDSYLLHFDPVGSAMT